MRRTMLAITMTALAGLLTVAFTAREASGAEKERGALFVVKVDRGNTRTILFRQEYFSAGFDVVDLTADQEIDVTSVVFMSDVEPVTTVVKGKAVIAYSELTGVAPVTFVTTGTETQQHTFNPPLRLRAGERFSLQRFGNDAATATYDITLHGTIPGTALATGVQVR